MACGCKGSTANENPRRQVRGQAREQRQPRPPLAFGDAGFTWTGPAGRSDAKAPPAATPSR